MRTLHVDISVEDCRAELWLNDIPLGLAGPRNPFVSVAAPMYVVNGFNALEIVVNPGPEPAVSRNRTGEPLPDQASAHARLAALYPGQFTDDPNAQVLISTDWISGPLGHSPLSVRNRVDLGQMYGDWPWQSAPRLTLDWTTVTQLADLLEHIRVSLQVGDASVLGQLARSKFESGARAFPTRTLPEIVRQFVSVMERNAKTPGWSMQPLEPSAFSFRLVANGRLIECLNKDWKPTLRSVPVEGSHHPMYFPMFLGVSARSFAIFL